MILIYAEEKHVDMNNNLQTEYMHSNKHRGLKYTHTHKDVFNNLYKKHAQYLQYMG